MSLGSARRPRGSAVVVASHWHAEHPRGLPGIVIWWRRHRKSLRAIVGEAFTRLRAWIGSGTRIVRAVGDWHASRPELPSRRRVCGTGRRGRSSCAIQRAKARYTYWTRLHVFTTSHRVWNLYVFGRLGEGFTERSGGSRSVARLAHSVVTQEVCQGTNGWIGRSLVGTLSSSLLPQSAVICHGRRASERLRRKGRGGFEDGRFWRARACGGRGQARIQGYGRVWRSLRLEGIGTAERRVNRRYGGGRIWVGASGRERTGVRRGREGSCRCHRADVEGQSSGMSEGYKSTSSRRTKPDRPLALWARREARIAGNAAPTEFVARLKKALRLSVVLGAVRLLTESLRRKGPSCCGLAGAQ